MESRNQQAAWGIERELWQREKQIGARRPGRLPFEIDRRRCLTMWTLPLWAAASPGFRQQRGWPSWLRRKLFCCWRPSVSATEPAGGREEWLWHRRLRAICRDWEMCCAATGKFCATCALTLGWNCQEGG